MPAALAPALLGGMALVVLGRRAPWVRARPGARRPRLGRRIFCRPGPGPSRRLVAGLRVAGLRGSSAAPTPRRASGPAEWGRRGGRGRCRFESEDGLVFSVPRERFPFPGIQGCVQVRASTSGGELKGSPAGGRGRSGRKRRTRPHKHKRTGAR